MVIRYNYKLRSNNVTVEPMLPQTPWHPEMSPPLVLTSAIESPGHTVRLCVWGGGLILENNLYMVLSKCIIIVYSMSDLLQL